MHGGDWPPKLSVRASISVIPVLHTWTSAVWLVLLNLLLKFLVPDDPVLFEAPLWVFSVLVFSSSECKQQSLSEKTQSAFPELLIFSHTVLVKFHKADISWHWVLQECLAPDPCPPNYCSGTYWVRKPSCRQVRQRVYDLQHQKKSPALTSRSLQYCHCKTNAKKIPRCLALCRVTWLVLALSQRGQLQKLSSNQLVTQELPLVGWSVPGRWTKFLQNLFKLQHYAYSLCSCSFN